MKDEVLKYQQKCFSSYLAKVGLPPDYSYIDGIPVRPLVPVETCLRSVMIVGAYPSARFESRRGHLVPVADNLGPFQPELYFDGVRVRKQESAHGLEKYILEPLDLQRSHCWITDLVKVFLFKPEHIANYKSLGVQTTLESNRARFFDYAKKSIPFLVEELKIAKPALVLTLGEEVARVVANDFSTSSDQLLAGNAYELSIGGKRWQVAHVAHPDACRRGGKWKSATEKHMMALRHITRQITTLE
jgi:uracil-DNA glycosylase